MQALLLSENVDDPCRPHREALAVGSITFCKGVTLIDVP